jgi:hypothetical protein
LNDIEAIQRAAELDREVLKAARENAREIRKKNAELDKAVAELISRIDERFNEGSVDSHHRDLPSG